MSKDSSSKVNYGGAGGTVTLHGLDGSIYSDGSIISYDASYHIQYEPLDAEIQEMKDDIEEHAKRTDARLDAIEDQILIVRRDVLLEEDYKELRDAWQAYNDLVDKLKTFKALKDSA